MKVGPERRGSLKNWCFQIIVLEKILESTLDSKKIKSVNPKRNQSWKFIGRTDAEAEALILPWSRLPCPLPFPGACSNSCPLSRWCHPTISPSVIPSLSCLQSFPASGSFLMSWFFSSDGQSIGVSASILPMHIQDWFPLGLSALISLQSKGLLQHHTSKASILQHSAFFMVQLSHPYVITGKTIALTIQTSVGKVMSLLFNMLSSLAIAFFQGASVFYFHGCSHHLQQFWSPRK